MSTYDVIVIGGGHAGVEAAVGAARAGSAPLPHALRIRDVARRTRVSLADVIGAAGIEPPEFSEALTTGELEIKYEGYFARERASAERMRSLGDFPLPVHAPCDRMRSLSTEARQELAARRPVTLAQASTIPGISTSDLQNLVLELERWHGDHALPASAG